MGKYEPAPDRLKRMMDRLIEAASEDVDNRLSDGQLHSLVVEVLGAEPLAHVANIIALAENSKSKITLSPAESIRGGLALHDRLYGPVDVKARKKPASENQFELTFAWATDDGEETAVIPVNVEG